VSIYGGTLDAVTVDPATGRPAPGVAVYAFDAATAGTLLGSVLSDNGGGFVLDLPAVTADRVWVSTSTTGARFPVLAQDALDRRALASDVAASLATKANAATVAAQTTRLDGLDTTVAAKANTADVSTALAAKLDTTTAAASYAPRSTTTKVEGTVGLLTTLSEAQASTGLQVIGDSTGNAPDEWVYLTGQWLAARYPAYTVRHRLWDDSTQGYAAPTTIQSGPNGERRAVFTGVRSMAHPGDGTAVSGDLDLRVKVAADDWTSAVASAQTLVARFGASAALRSFRFQINGAGGNVGKLVFDWYAGGALQGAALSSVPVPGTDGQPMWVRVTLDVDNGSAQHVVTFYTSTDGVAWTQLGTATTRAGVTSLDPGTGQDYEIGARSTNAEPLFGSVYEVEVRNGLVGPSVCPRLPEFWRRLDTSVTITGSPVLTIVNGSNSGSGMSYFGDSVRLPKMTPNYGQALFFLSTGHNEGYTHGTALLSSMGALLATVKGRLSHAPAVLLTQNPRTAPAGELREHAARRGEYLAWAKVNGVGCIDTYGAFLADGRPIAGTLVNADGIHPTAAGSQVWRDAVTAALT
jgi:lysophospholipase L1-like esterase